MVRSYKDTLFCDFRVPDSFCAGEQNAASRRIDQFFSGNSCRIDGIKTKYSKPFRQLAQCHLRSKAYLICTIHWSVQLEILALFIAKSQIDVQIPR